MKRLVVNADDFGWSERRNRGILEAHRRGVVTSASLLANGRAFEHAVDMARTAPGLDLGLHLNLSEGAALFPGHRTLADRAGRFFGKEQARRRAPVFDPGEVERETETQIARLRVRGIEATHLDGHQHIHVHGAAAAAVARAAARHGIRWVRCPADVLVPPDADPRALERVLSYRRLAEAARPTFERAGLSCLDAFGGVALSGQLSLADLAGTLGARPERTLELMVHPGYSDTLEGFAGRDRERELEILTDPLLRAAIRRAGFDLASFRDLSDTLSAP